MAEFPAVVQMVSFYSRWWKWKLTINWWKVLLKTDGDTFKQQQAIVTCWNLWRNQQIGNYWNRRVEVLMITMRNIDLCFGLLFIVGRNWFKKYSLQKLYLNLKEPL
jgi:hypothetical protein